MITLFKKTPREKILDIIAKKYTNYEVIRFSDFSGDVTEIIHALTAIDLFGNKKLVFLSDVDRELWGEIIKTLSILPKDTIVFWSEESFPVALIKGIPQHDVVEEKEKKEQVKSNPFQIAHELPIANGKQLWVTYQQLVQEGNAPEAIFGILWWKLKDIAKKKKIISEQFKKTLRRFLATYSSARNTGGDLETGLEKVLLEISKDDI